jgi:uncharacterized protein
MIELGQYATLEVVKTTDFGVYLDGKQFGEVLLPKRYVPEGLEPGHDVKIFLYCDSEDRVIATTEIPNIIVGECAYMKVKDTADHGAFLEWGLMKDLFVPFREQAEPMELGKKYIVKALLDTNTDRIHASSKILKHVSETVEEGLEVGQEVKLLVWTKTDLGYKMIINDQYTGVVFKNEVFQPLQIGEILRGYIKNIREDRRIDLSLKKQGYHQQIPDATDIILKELKDNNGFLDLTDNSDPNDIYDMLHISKKAFKKAIGSLYKQRLIILEKDGIRLVK